MTYLEKYQQGCAIMLEDNPDMKAMLEGIARALTEGPAPSANYSVRCFIAEVLGQSRPLKKPLKVVT